jgi:hypothetical protein
MIIAKNIKKIKIYNENRFLYFFTINIFVIYFIIKTKNKKINGLLL